MNRNSEILFINRILHFLGGILILISITWIVWRGPKDFGVNNFIYLSWKLDPFLMGFTDSGVGLSNENNVGVDLFQFEVLII